LGAISDPQHSQIRLPDRRNIRIPTQLENLPGLLRLQRKHWLALDNRLALRNRLDWGRNGLGRVLLGHKQAG
jgi:hypothetical protein